MSTSRIAVFAAVCALVLAGCSGITFDGSGASSGTVTPAPVPEPAGSGSPPGIGPDGVTNPSLVANTHGAVVKDTGYTVVSNRTVTATNGTVWSDVQTRVATLPDGSFRADISIRGPRAPVMLGRPPARATFWSDGDKHLRKLERDNRTVYSEFTPDGFAGTMSFWVHWVALDGPPEQDAANLLESFRSLTVERTEDGYVVRGRGLTPEESLTERLDEPDDATLVARIRGDGLITSYRVAYTAETDDGTRVRVERQVRFEAVGETTVTRPEWYDRAVDDATPTPATESA